MTTENSGDWRPSAHVQCPNCKEDHYKLVHSPLLDHYTLYCDSCPIMVEVSFYSPTMIKINRNLEQPHTHKLLMQVIETRLKPCSCGGQFRARSPRRCFQCHTIVFEGEAGVDILPGWMDSEEEPTLEEFAMWEEFEAKFIRRDDTWK